MKDETRILLLEDRVATADLTRRALRRVDAAFSVQRVDTRAAFTAQLETEPPDLILSDFPLAEFDGYTALAIAREKCPDVPFLFVTGALGEAAAIEMFRKGAADCILRSGLARLAPSIRRALREARERAEHKRAEERLRQSREQLRDLSVYLQYVREEERIRIAREVHDELGQSLTCLKLAVSWLTDHLPSTLRPLRAKTRSMAKQIDETIEAVRRIATELRPSLLDTAGLPAALEWQANEFQKRTGIPCRVHTATPETFWDQDVHTTFFRIFQETLTNIVRHANASKVEVRLSHPADHLVLEVKDNGRGISEGEVHNTRSIGILGMRERAALLGGEVRFRGEPGKGTTVWVRIPHRAAPRSRSLAS